MPGVFDGVTVVELADPRNQFIGKLFAESGARVIQIEPLNGSPSRWTGPFVDDKEDPDKCLDYWYFNTGKDSICIDITRTPGQDLVRQLIATADIFIESTKPGMLKPCGLDYESVAPNNPALIYLSFTDFGQSGPWVDFEMNDTAHLALGGVMASSGYSDPHETPIGPQRSHAYNMSALMAAHTLTATLYERMESGLGQHVDISIHDCVATSTERAIGRWVWNNMPLLRQTGQSHSVAYERFELWICSDGRFIKGSNPTFSGKSWAQFVAWMREQGVLEDLGDEKWLEASARNEDLRTGNAIQSGFERLLATVTSEEGFSRGQAIGMPWSIVRAPEENLDLKHYKERGFWAPVEHPEIGKTVDYPRGVFCADDLGTTPPRRAPLRAEHTRLILHKELGIADEAVAALIESGVIRAATDEVSAGARSRPIPARVAVHSARSGHRERPQTAPVLPDSFLNGIRIIDLSWKTVGPFPGRMLTPYGAEVIHIEPPGRPDDHRFDGRRTTGPAVQDQREWRGAPWRNPENTAPYYSSPYFDELHSGKLGVNLNTRHPEGKRLLERLIQMSDALNENFSGGVLPSWGLGWDRLQEINPELVYVSTSGFGHRGEWGGFRSYGQIAQASSGLTFTSGLPDRTPAGWGYSYMDITGGWGAGLGMMMGLLQAKRTGKGVRIDYAVTENGMSLLGPYFLDAQINGRSTRRPNFPPGNHSEWPAVAPHNTYRTAGTDRQGQDWWVFIACETQQQFESLCHVIGRPELVVDSRFKTTQARVANQDVLDEIIAIWTAPRRRYQIMDALQRAGVIAAAIQGAEDRVEYDPQLRHRDMYPVISNPEVGEFLTEEFAPKLSRTPAHAGRRGPLLREHTEYVYGELLGLGSSEIKSLESDGVI